MRGSRTATGIVLACVVYLLFHAGHAHLSSRHGRARTHRDVIPAVERPRSVVSNRTDHHRLARESRGHPPALTSRLSLGKMNGA